jgi:Spy/CpxP family protein refolding chaperone
MTQQVAEDPCLATGGFFSTLLGSAGPEEGEMPKIAIALLGISLFLAGTAGAKANEAPAPAPKVGVEQRRQQLIAKNLDLDEAESKKFWPVYNVYRAERNKLLVRSSSLMREYRDNAATIDDANALKMLRLLQQLRGEEVKLRWLFVDRFAEILPARKVLRYYQIEDRLEAIARFETTRAIHLQP